MSTRWIEVSLTQVFYGDIVKYQGKNWKVIALDAYEDQLDVEIACTDTGECLTLDKYGEEVNHYPADYYYTTLSGGVTV